MRIRIAVENPRTEERSEELTALTDTGATLTVVPRPGHQQLGSGRVRSASLVLVATRGAA